MNIVPALIFLINTIFTLYILCVMLRFFLQWVKADFYNPLCQFLMTVTNPLLIPLRRVIPGWFGLDIAAVVLMILLELVNVSLLSLVTHFPFSWFLLIVAAIKLFKLMINMYFFSILIRAIMSWVNPHPHNPIFIALVQLTEPLLRPVRRLIPPMSGFDLSPIVVLIGLQLISILFGHIIGV